MRSEKRCPRCERTLPLSDFYINRSMGCGRQGFCKRCQKAYQLAWRLLRDKKRRATARKRFDRALIYTRTSKGLSDQERHFQRLLMVETRLRVEFGWFDRMLKAEEAAYPNRPLHRVPKPQNTRWYWFGRTLKAEEQADG